MDHSRNLESQKLLNENIEIANQILSELKNQDEQFNEMGNSLSNIEYYSEKSKNILRRLSSVIKRFWYKSEDIELDREYVKLNNENIKSDNHKLEKNTNNSFQDKLNLLKKICIQIGDKIDEQNNLLIKMDSDVEKNDLFLKKNNQKINNLTKINIFINNK